MDWFTALVISMLFMFVLDLTWNDIRSWFD